MLAVMLGASALTAGPAGALDPQRLITQYTHRVWTIGSNGLGSAPLSITQAPDGYLLFGAQDGIYRFNGERFQRWQPWGSRSRPVRFINEMLIARDGSLYLSLRDGLARYRKGKLFFYERQLVEPSIFEDRDGRVWVGNLGLNETRNPLCSVNGNHVNCARASDADECSFFLRAAPDPRGGVLSFAKEGVCRVHSAGRGSRLDYPGKQSMGFARPVWDGAGHVYVLLRNSTQERYLETDGLRWSKIPGSEVIADGRTFFRDRQGVLWVGTWRSGLWRIVNGKAEHYTRADGLSGNNVAAIYEDRGGSVWVATTEGVDQFRASPVVRFGAREGLSGDRPANLFVTRSGELWVANVFGVDAFRGGRLLTPAPRVSSRGDALSVVQDSDGRAWSLVGGIGIFYENERQTVRNALRVPLADPQDLAATPDGNVWTGNIFKDQATPRGGLVQMRAGRVVAMFPTPASVDYGVIYKLAPDDRDGLWVAVADHGALLFRNGRFTPLSLPANTNVVGIAPIKSGSAWMATMDGLYHVSTQGQARRLGVAQGLPCETFPAVTTTSTGDLWLKADCGLLHVAKRELDRFLNNESAKVRAELIDAADGAPIDEYSNHPYETPDGKVWFSNFTGLFMVDPKAASGPKLPVPAFIENIMADGKSFLSSEGRRSPTRPRRIEISFSGVDFDRPDRVAFRYELTRGTQQWHGETNQRTASFTDLGPGRYRFTVIACENGARCSVRPATLTFEIPPTFIQTWMFKVALAFVAAFLAWAGYRIWLRQVTIDIQRRTEARLGERERIARDLHDTLLQGFQGLLLRIQGVANNLPREDPLRNGLESALNRGEQIIVEGRNRVRELRVDEDGLPEVLRKFVDDASLDCDVEIELEILGFPRELRPGVATEVGQIAREALSNACRHAEASRIVLTAEFGLRQLSVRISDDGKGLGTPTSGTDATPHFGLSGMRERADRLKGSFTIESSPGRGTDVSVTLSSSVAYVPKSNVITDLFGRLGKLVARTRARLSRRSPTAGSST